MARAAKEKKKDKAVTEDADDASEAKAKSSKKLLLAAAAMSVASLGVGFYLARMAYLKDASAYDVDYVASADEGGAEGADHGGHDEGADAHAEMAGTGDVVDPLAKDGHPAEEAMALKAEKEDGGHGKEGEAEPLADTGLWDFGDIMTNIEGYDLQGAPKKSFLKLSLVMVYRADAGAAETVQKREPFMRDLFNGYLRGLNERDVRGMGGVLHLKAELLKRARASMGSDLPQEILINDLIVQ